MQPETRLLYFTFLIYGQTHDVTTSMAKARFELAARPTG
ncbi:unnamed protein product [Acanthoscelides obtectus]|uniref:Uncharacterized protein n=1 Tax=Acanthoscelides obtectus TaxID=200917 RepID=A0A9P0JW04_ACAOB|nr:unnamed protein product [Acanthoscelides obtectus]CAK1671178.1 hypothetical protein AOBTE_LOCUS28115 [Acanthoscelides obtectus]